jgi:hypothetical protein
MIDGTEIMTLDGTSMKIDTINELTTDAGVTIEGVKMEDKQIDVNIIIEADLDVGVTIEGALHKDNRVTVDDVRTDGIREKTNNYGVNIENILLKDQELYVSVIKEIIPAAGVTIDSVLCKDQQVTCNEVILNNAPTAATHATTKSYVDALAAGLTYHAEVDLASDGSNYNVAGAEQTVDGTLTSASRVLLKDQTAPDENGVWVTGGAGWTRATDMDASAEFNKAAVFVVGGTNNAGRQYVCTNTNPTVGVTAITFVRFASILNSGTIQVDVINEDTGAAGVTIDTNTLIKDGKVTTLTASISTLTATRLMASDGSKNIVSVTDLTSWVAGTTNQITITDDTDGTITIGTPQDIHNAASPTFSALSVDTITEKTGDAGVTIESIKLEDGTIEGATGVYANDLAGGVIRTMIVDDNGDFGYNSSLRERKMNIKNLGVAHWIYKLNPVSFNYRRKIDGKWTHDPIPQKLYGLIAEEAERVNKDLCYYSDMRTKTGLTGVHYENLIIPLLTELRNLKSRVDIMEHDLSRIKNKMVI